MIETFDSVAAFAKAASGTTNWYKSGGSWTGDETHAVSLQRAIGGYEPMVAPAEALLSQINSAVEVPSLEHVPAMAGAYPIVPDFLAGDPLCMRARAPVENDRAPIGLFVCVTSSAAVSSSVMNKRGAAMFALTLALTRVRPVSLYLVNMMDGSQDGESVIVIRINTAPLDTASAAYAISSVGFARNLCYGYSIKKHGSHGLWPKRYRYSADNTKFFNSIIEACGHDPAHSLFLKPAEAHDEIVLEPVRWVNEQIERFTKGDNE